MRLLGRISANWFDTFFDLQESTNQNGAQRERERESYFNQQWWQRKRVKCESMKFIRIANVEVLLEHNSNLKRITTQILPTTTVLTLHF